MPIFYETKNGKLIAGISDHVKLKTKRGQINGVIVDIISNIDKFTVEIISAEDADINEDEADFLKPGEYILVRVEE